MTLYYSAVLPMRLYCNYSVNHCISLTFCLFDKHMHLQAVCPSLPSLLSPSLVPFSPPVLSCSLSISHWTSTHPGTTLLPCLSVPFPEVLDLVPYPAGVQVHLMSFSPWMMSLSFILSPVWMSFFVFSPVYVNDVCVYSVLQPGFHFDGRGLAKVLVCSGGTW